MIRGNEGSIGGHGHCWEEMLFNFPLNVFVFYHFACFKEHVLELKFESLPLLLRSLILSL